MIPLLITGAVSLGFVLMGKYGAKEVTSSILTNEYNHRFGYRPGEGPLTPKETVFIDPNSKSDIGRLVSALALEHKELEPFKGKLFDMTVTEGQSLRTLLMTVRGICEKQVELLSHVDAAVEHRKKADEDVENPHRIAELNRLNSLILQFNAVHEEYKKDLVVAVAPVSRFLEQFPTARVK